ncbi:MAG TPA: pyruvate kinase [Steroidobacteraceae bacterium]|nr:pyruvate kinase [Steroidobacteraceae bacterium]
MLRRRTKIVATLGPATDAPGVLEDVIRAGADVLRVNFSHGKAADHERRVRRAREAAENVGKHVALLGDLQGPKIRIERFADGRAVLSEGAAFVLDPDLGANDGTDRAVGITYAELAQDVAPGDELILGDGQIELTVVAVEGRKVICRVLTGGELGDQKGINRRGGGLSAKALTDKDRDDVVLGARLDIDYLAVSFVRQAADVEEARQLLAAAGSDARIVAKIERSEAIPRLDEIVRASDAVMVARGDLGIEVGYAELTGLQKHILQVARRHDRVTITATQMMESMIHSPVPTRAEVSDVANAVLDGSDAVMLSGESAVGKYPVRAIEAMAEVIEGAEKYQIAHRGGGERFEGKVQEFAQAIAHAVMYTANHIDVEAIVALTESGATPLWMSRIRSDIPIFAFTRNERTRRRVALYRGVYPVPFDITHTDPAKLYRAISGELIAREFVKPGDEIILTLGELSGVSGGTNTMKLLEVEA